MAEFRSMIGLYNPKGSENVGSVMRAAGCYVANAVYYTGQRYDRAARFSTDTQNIRSQIPLIPVDDLVLAAEEGVSIVCVELALGAIPLPQFRHPQRALYLFGPEDGTLPQSVIDRADATVFIPTSGCMNLAATVNVLLYDRMSKFAQSDDYESLIKKSRDTNNRVRAR
ncbi:RNA methyltransferase [Ketobacter sp. MCCC 1A13808]|uniref:RNA methyltransferase n=1 Tax=Ketobacter sp. MCCC 1A13808 TaxID=2602738 RepID=UPI000F183DF2|nr:RNA methyltransferase [Ketobacter sp. MCCC 1A13808]MVF13405.1 RNA methyltransferase [Ketobacter sp. MCCC 1A13808]RLP55796.1 MAG: TrmH family RNA methyltransferase [Ketobacter sp.]